MLSGQNPDDVPDLLVPPDDGIELLLLRPLHHLIAILIQSIVGALRIVRNHPLISPHLGEDLQEAVLRDLILLKEPLQLGLRLLQEREEEMLHRDILIPHRLRMVLRIADHPVCPLREILLSRAGDLRELVDLLRKIPEKGILRNSHLGQKLLNQAVLHRHQTVEEMELSDLLIPVIHGHLLAVIDRLHRFLRKFIDIHSLPPLLRARLFSHTDSASVFSSICRIL